MITIFTPTYNRKSTLNRLYVSLCNQSNKNFEWLMVDDGSQDETKKWVKSIEKNAPFKIKYIYQKNSGKHVAINTGVSHSDNNWFLILDSDDVLTSDAVSTMLADIEYYNNHINLVSFCYRKGYLNGEVVGLDLASSPELLISNPTNAGKLFIGDLVYLFKTDALAKFPFPVIENESFVPELYIWNKVSDLGDIYFFGKKIIYLCEYLPDGYSFNFKKNLKENPVGFSIHYFSQISREKSLKGKLKNIIRYCQCRIYSVWSK